MSVSSFLSASPCIRDADVVGLSWEGAWVYTLFARYIIYPFLLQAVTLVVSAADGAERKEGNICPSSKTHLSLIDHH